MPILNVISPYLYYIYFLFVIVLTITILLDNKPPEVTVAWLLAIYFLPYVGAVIYLFSGVNWKKRKIVKQLPEVTFKTYLGPILEQQRHFLEAVSRKIDNDMAKTVSLVLNSSNAIITLDNQVDFFYEGGPLFERMVEDLERAEETIHLEYFIYKSDRIGQRIGEILKRKARKGVKVRVLFDGVGNFRKMSWRFKRELRESGVEVRYFLDPFNVLTGRLLNYCNHRKIVVIDGKTAYTGGMNIGDEYINGGRRFSFWRDTHIRVTGESVAMLQGVFLSDWYNSGGEKIIDERFFPEPEVVDNYLPIQVVCSGPDSDWYTLKKLYFNLIANANGEVLIQSPYFIPDESIRSALEASSLSGVDVHLIMTGVADKRVPFWVAHTYFESLLKAGVNIYFYEKGFFHPKMLVVDGDIATVGSCNMDVRSFHLDYELNMVFYGETVCKGLVEQFRKDLQECRKLTPDVYNKLSFPARLRNGVFRMIAPVL
ncbi:cardiolipin synthase [Sediminispirochaeta smaragdinae]|jgi:cardiolipin synthase|uniref:Cardiolipin synthase n=1 Tax=Sediminispirochaeta smaragdinae (strain DSM 11293 / JCM 15392 / SEBR 4228) TaxID=573413 RepID=E1R608_SEDSS|nr:cardiolipin synthase [Sediminispirochaeta smaragdinae]ADK80773.1 phospholipase D/Transphosphatidylase [Sediminispirochaeta smaragdinae DSM 11293]